MGESKLTPLQYNVSIVNPDGTPTPYFIQLLQQLYEEKALTDAAVANAIIAGSGLSGGGSLIDGPVTLSASVQAILNLVSTTRGAILYRGAAVWSALLPGTAGNFLKTQGAGADPIWDVAGGGGGGGGIFPINAPPFSSFTWVNQGTSTLTVNADGSITLIPQAVGSGNSVRGAFVPLPAGNYDRRIGFIPASPSTGFQIQGVALLESSSGKFILFGCYRDASSGCLWAAMNFPSATGAQTNVNIPSTPSNYTFAHPVYAHLKDDGTTRTCNLGLDPNLFPFLGYSQPHGTFITPDKIGIVSMNSGGTTGQTGMTCFDWR